MDPVIILQGREVTAIIEQQAGPTILFEKQSMPGPKGEKGETGETGPPVNTENLNLSGGFF